MFQFDSNKNYKISITGVKRLQEVAEAKIEQLEEGFISFTDVNGKNHMVMGKNLEVYIEEL